MRISRSEQAGPAAEDPAAGAEDAAPAGAYGRSRVRGRRRGLRWRTREAGAATAGTMGTGVLFLARLIRIVTVLVVLLIALAIVLVDVGANHSNTIVKGVHEGANFFVGAFTGLVTDHGHYKRELSIDWGIALVVYLLVGSLLAGAVARAGRRGLLFERTHRPAF